MTTPPSEPTSIPPSVVELISATPAPVPAVEPVATSSFARFFDPGYYVTPAPFENDFVLGEPLAVLFLVFLIAAFGLLIRAQMPRLKRRSEYKRFAYWLLSFGTVGLILLYFRRDHVPYLGMRLWLALLLLGVAVWVIRELMRFAKR